MTRNMHIALPSGSSTLLRWNHLTPNEAPCSNPSSETLKSESESQKLVSSGKLLIPAVSAR